MRLFSARPPTNMTDSFTEQRRQTRRSLEMPVAYHSKSCGTLDLFAIGKTKNVSPKGLCIRTRPGQVPEKDSPMVLMLTPEEEASFLRHSTPVHIDARVVWVDAHTRQFGVSFA